MFRSRSKDDAAPPPVDEEPRGRDPQAPKGRPTPKRSEAEALRRAVVKPPTSRKEASKRAREARRAALTKQREALLSGDERHLPSRDRGPVRRYARDFVDAKFHVAEFFLPIAVVILIMSMLPSIQARNIALLLWLVVIVMIVFDSILMTRRLKKRLRAKYPDESLRGASAYALMRTMQMRRMRLPKPQIKRGEEPR
ncbi:DUF3043 domain-containing protein [Streptomyces radicis]|uniref:DUF3043 domain-containing protein n=1 Tax=Streptomyces radicis TaxID=1750517 RepID=A0A3A9WIS1_9ACTN|nr:DUF3043 domain-containing protein [Streptomyces radicis]RKN12213.1 DUF3043 domain-containing protein [Streptomyces radicis]RKN25735.1 DUF3043 domain-containing protein [Streptomyces radicis]